MSLKIESSNVIYSDNYMETKYEYNSTKVERKGAKLLVSPQSNAIHLRTRLTPPRLGLMLVGWGGNNGSTLTAAIIANKLGMSWRTKSGVQQANWFGSVTQASTVRLGAGLNGEDVYVPMCDLVPMVQPDDLVLDGWDISGLGLVDAMKRAQVLEPELQDQLIPHMIKLKPRPSVYNPDFIAANQVDRADNLIKGSKQEQFDQICRDIDDFKESSGVDKVIILWTANTERFCELIPGVNDTASNLLSSIACGHPEISPSIIFATAAISKGCTYINGSPQNTFVQGVVELAERKGVFIAGDDFKSGQTKIKSVLVDFLISAGIKPVSIVSYNHLGNNDGKNLSAPKQFKSKEISKSNVVDDMVQSNRVMYKPNESPDHCVVIKYVPYVGDSKRAMDEYTSELMLGGHNTIVLHNTCEDSLLAVPIILDLVLLAELFSRVEFKSSEEESYTHMHPVLSILSYLLKAPLVPRGTPVINALFKQRACIENFLRACLGLAPESSLMLEHKIPFLMKDYSKGKKLGETVVANGNH